MPQWRKLYSRVVESVDVDGMLNYFTRLLWVLLPTQLCSEGRGQDYGAWVRSKVSPLRKDVSLEIVERAMACHAERGMVVRYEVDGRRFFELVNWHKYQGNTSRETASDYPTPPAEAKPVVGGSAGEGPQAGAGDDDEAAREAVCVPESDA